MPFRSIACFTTRKKEANITLVLKQVTTKNESSVDGLACMMQFWEPEFISSIYLISFRPEKYFVFVAFMQGKSKVFVWGRDCNKTRPAKITVVANSKVVCSTHNVVR